jgi:hypothetical protein
MLTADTNGTLNGTVSSEVTCEVETVTQKGICHGNVFRVDGPNLEAESFTILSGTDELASLQGEGTFSGSFATADGTYTMAFHFHPKGGESGEIETRNHQSGHSCSDAAFVSQSVPREMEAGRSYAATVTMRNIGSTTWTDGANPYRLGSQSPQDNLTWGVGRVEVPAAIAPGAEAVFSFTVTAPSDRGVYAFQWGMLQEWVEWFGELTPTINVTVRGPDDVAVPDVVGLIQPQAAQAIRDADLNPRFIFIGGGREPRPRNWEVSRQSPQAGTPVPRGSTVTLDLVSAEK